MAAFIPGTQPPSQTSISWWFPFVGNQLLLTSAGTPLQGESLAEWDLAPRRSQYLGLLDNRPCYSAELDSTVTSPPGLILCGLRQLYGVLDEALFALAGLAYQIMEWDRTHQFCGHCGTPTMNHASDRAKHCPACGLRQYPRISPAMIVLISRDQDILLGRAPRFRPGMYSLIAGYVEPGESLEQAVVREVKEEVGVSIADIRYWGSQPWPFPHTLMVGFTAAYDGGDIVIDADELVDATWFSYKELPELPSRASIARKMIDWFVQQHAA